jgi:SAM-dependent methyltransferase
MWKSEAEWINRQIVDLGLDHRPVRCLNLGSSTRAYRERQKPYIHDLLLAPLARFGTVCHVDAKADDGVDEVGDFCDPAFGDRLAQTRYDLILCNNLLTHVACRALVFAILDRCLADGGYAIVTAPSVYPYCADPYDAKYRPSVADLGRAVPDVDLIASTVLDSDETHMTRLLRNPRLSLGLAFNILVPVAGFERWRNVASDLPNLFTPFRTTCVVLHRTSQGV